jgi:hypothetical protein
MCVRSHTHIHTWHERTYRHLHALVLIGGCFTVEDSCHFCFHFTVVVKVVANKPFLNFVFTDASMLPARSTFAA